MDPILINRCAGVGFTTKRRSKTIDHAIGDQNIFFSLFRCCKFDPYKPEKLSLNKLYKSKYFFLE